MNILIEEDRAVISECDLEAALYDMYKLKDTEEEAVRTIEDKDITVIEVSEEERRDLREKLQPIYDRYCLDYMDIIEKIEKNQE